MGYSAQKSVQIDCKKKNWVLQTRMEPDGCEFDKGIAIWLCI